MSAIAGGQVSTGAWGKCRLWFRRRPGFLMVLPAVLIMLWVGVFPLFYSLGISLFQWEPKIPERPFVWFRNYGDLLQNGEFWASLKVTAILVVSSVTLEFFIGLWLAALLVDALPGRKFFMPILMLPVMMVPVVVGYTWKMLWDPLYGPVNQVLGWFAGRQVTISWLTSSKTVFPAIIMTEIWQWTPFMFVVLLAGLTAVNPELQEAAAIDGASSWKIFWKVLLPVMRPIILVAVLFRTIDVVKVFDIVYVTTGGGPGYLTQPITFFLYRMGARFFRMGFTAAGSWLLLVIVSVIISLAVKRVGED
jgi:multiple sugar transport system permease protein